MQLREAYCQGRVWSGYHSYQCARKAKRDGWCNQHHPDTVAAKRAAKMAQYDEERRQRQAATAAKAEQARRAACFDDLVAALEKIVIDEENRAKSLRHREAWSLVKFSEERMAAARAALARARGET